MSGINPVAVRNYCDPRFEAWLKKNKKASKKKQVDKYRELTSEFLQLMLEEHQNQSWFSRVGSFFKKLVMKEPEGDISGDLVK